MSRKKCILWIFLMVMGLAVPVDAKETKTDRQGNIEVLEEEMRNRKEDYMYLEMEIQRLLRECYL